MKRTAEQIHKEFVGTCTGIFTDEERNDGDLLQQVDKLLFKCDCCGWWCDADEESELHEDSGDKICKDCEYD